MKRRIRLLLLHVLALLARPFVRRRVETPRTILYIKPDHLGDLLLATPVLADLRQRFPIATITALVGPWSAMVLERNPNIDVLLTCPFPGFERRPPQTSRSLGVRVMALLQPYRLLWRYAMQVRAGRYDAALIGRDDHWWGAALAMLVGIPVRVGFAVPECRPFLTQALPWNPHEHVTVQGLALVDALGGPRRSETAPLAQFNPAPADRAWVAEWLRSQGVSDEQRLIVLHPGTGGPTKHWLSDRWAVVADALSADPTVRLLLTGGPGEEALVEEVAAQMQRPPLVLAGKTSVGQLAALLGHATLVLGVDSGPLHLAAAQSIPTIHLYGPGDARRFGPWGDPQQHTIIRAELACSPCGVFSACPRGLAQPECMTLIGSEEVIERAQTILANKDDNA